MSKKSIHSLEFFVRQDHTSNHLDKEISFNVPEDVSTVSIEVRGEKQMWLTYMVYDERRELRWQYLKVHAPQPLVIHENKEKTSPYTIYGPIGAGNWILDISILVAEKIEANIQWCTCVITFNDHSVNNVTDHYMWQDRHKTIFRLSEFNSDQIFNDNAGWYKGDFHTHTIYSDGEMTREENIISAANQQLDFFVTTEHNLVPTSWFDETNILVIPGVEVTSPYGHANILNTNTSPFANNRLKDMYTEEGMNQILTDDYGYAAISINHPFLTEWKWVLKETPLAIVNTMEIWNDPTYPPNQQATEWALIAWNYLLNDGHKITGIGGSDSHLKLDQTYEGSEVPSLIGDPGTFVYCEKLTATNVINGLKKDHVTVSRGKRIKFSCGDFISGDHVYVNKGTIRASVETDENIYIEWVVDGKVAQTDEAILSEFMFSFKEDDENYHWIRVDVRYANGTLYGFSNPLFFGKKKERPKLTKWGQIIELMKDIVVDE